MNYLEPESLVKEYKKFLSQLKEGIISLSALLVEFTETTL